MLVLGVLVLFFAGPAARAGARVRTRAMGSPIAVPLHAIPARAIPARAISARAIFAPANFAGASFAVANSAPAISVHPHGAIRDVAATRAYIEADYRLTTTSRRHLSLSLAATHALAKRTVSECPLAGEGAYVNKASNEISEEVGGTVVAVAFHSDSAAIRAFVSAIKRLRWSNPRLTRDVRGYVVKLSNLAALEPADICTDVKAFAATGFSSAPEATLRFNKLYFAADVEVEEVPLRLLAPYEDSHGVDLLRRIKKLEAPLADAEAKGVQDWMQIMRGLALSV